MADAVFPWELDRATGKRPGRAVRVPVNAILPYPVAQRIGTRQYLWLRRCPTCGRARLYLAQKATCSNSCGVAFSHWRRPHQERRMRELHRLAMQSRLRNQQARIADEVRGLTPDAIWRKAYDRGYAAGTSARRKGARRLRDHVSHPGVHLS